MLSQEDLLQIGNHFTKLGEIFTNAAKQQSEVVESTKKVPKDPNAPKRPLSSYIMFCNDNRDKVRNQHPGISSQDISKILGEMWNSINEVEKKRYELIFQRQKQRYQEEIREYEQLKNLQQRTAIDPMHETFELANSFASGIVKFD
ncbi:hypothetical protein BB560_004135 [Smittium megazygosporum]|uniref:HMG box domain-containing protein n=2 Tax=Smittium megazygosporum TaxID=133381 RepID=A0A2T9ZA51_9FUNG|nr:hypothetical protein BB560_004135 [Smittium megazygosporum]